MTIKAIMSDIDGTLLTSHHDVSKKTIEAIRKAREKGILFGLSTGREVDSVKKLIKVWDIEDLVDMIIGNGGASLCDFCFAKEKQSYPLDGYVIKAIMNHYKDMKVNFVITEKGMIFTPKEDELVRNLAKGDDLPYKVVDFDAFLNVPHPKLMIVCHPGDMDKLVERGRSFNNDKYKVKALTTARILYEYMDCRVSKTYGMKQVMDSHHIRMSEVCSFGDEDNDYDMIINSKVGVVMANGSEKTKSVADFITDDNDHDGIAHFINDYLLKE